MTTTGPDTADGPTGVPPIGPPERAGLPGVDVEVIDARPMGGGDVAAVWRVRLVDGRALVVKRGTTPAELEAEGLAALRATGARVPEVIGVAGGTLVLELVTDHGDPAAFGTMLAQVHASTSTSFGWRRDNVIGALPQHNARHDDWPTFVATQRLLPHLDALDARDPNGAHRSVAARIRAAIESGHHRAVLDHRPAPSLVHGDLWSGNVLGWAAMIDPAVHHADREVDLAMLALFGSIPPAMLRAYEAHTPLPEGVEHRRLLLQLNPLLVHVRLFGAGYLDGVGRRLDALGW